MNNPAISPANIPVNPLDQEDRTREVFSEFEVEHDRIRQDEDLALEDLFEELVGREARFTKAVVLQEHAAERLREIRADHDWSWRHAFRRLRERLR